MPNKTGAAKEATAQAATAKQEKKPKARRAWLNEGQLVDRLTAYATVTEASTFTHMSRSTLYKLMDSNQLTYTKVGGSRRIPWTALREFMERCTVHAAG